MHGHGVKMLTLLAPLLLSASCSGTTIGDTYQAETQFLKADEFCSDAHMVEVRGDRWFGSALPPEGLPPGQSYHGELYIVDKGPDKGNFGEVNRGTARFTTGSTTVTLTRRRSCV